MGHRRELLDLEELAFLVAVDGPEAHHDRLVAIARDARDACVARVAAGVLADADSPAVARQRAFGIVARGLAEGLATADLASGQLDAA